MYLKSRLNCLLFADALLEDPPTNERRGRGARGETTAEGSTDEEEDEEPWSHLETVRGTTERSGDQRKRDAGTGSEGKKRKKTLSWRRNVLYEERSGDQVEERTGDQAAAASEEGPVRKKSE